MEARVPFAYAVEAFGVPAVVRRPAPQNVPIETAGVWSLAPPDDMPAGRGDFMKGAARRVFSLPRVALSATVAGIAEQPPVNTLVDAPELDGGPVLRWRVDGVERAEPEAWRVFLVKA